jgi:hypothetical protein
MKPIRRRIGPGVIVRAAAVLGANAGSFCSVMVRHNEEVKEPTRQTLRRRSDEPRLEIGDTVVIKEGVVGVVLARFTPSGERRNEVHYIVELRPANAGFFKTGKQGIP